MNRLMLTSLLLIVTTTPSALAQTEAHSKDPPDAASPKYPPFAARYEGRWEMQTRSYGTVSNTNSLIIESQTDTEATGRFTMYQSTGATGCFFKDAPTVIRRLNAQEVFMTVTHQQSGCGVKRFKFTMEPSGRLLSKSADGTQVTYFDPQR